MKKIAALAAGAALVLAGCGGGSEPAAPSAPPRTLTVSAAASLTDVFGELEKRFETDNPGVDVVLNLGASSTLAEQIVNGAPADVFAAASPATMKTVADAGQATGEQPIFTTNRLQIVVATGNPKGITGFADLNKPGIITVVCAAQVPCGAATEKIEKATGITLTPASEEPDVKSVLSKVTSGNADAGVVYVTDVKEADAMIDGVTFPEADQAINDYPIAVLKNSAQVELAMSFVELVRGPDGQKALEAAGFGTS
ncbi:MAG: molybdate ABC transporter substrate-binding protein [Pseudonocardia sp.]